MSGNNKSNPNAKSPGAKSFDTQSISTSSILSEKEGAQREFQSQTASQKPSLTSRLVQNQTPAPSKRFLTPQFSSSARQSARQSGQSLTQKQTPSSSVTPLPRTLRFVTPAKQQREDINTNFEDETSSLSDPRLQVFTPCGVRGTDAIDDVDVELADGDSAGHNLNVGLTDSKGSVYDVQAAEFATPYPRKRRKMSTPTRLVDERVLMSSSPSNPVSDTSDDGGENDSFSDIELDQYSPSGKPAIGRFGSRFKRAPSLATPLLDDTESKPIFRQPDPKLHIAAEMAAVLPDAFTPSRRKGRKDYLPGGLADTIRNAVLGIATDMSQTSSRLEGTLVPVKSAHVDASGRAIIATAHDGDAVREGRLLSGRLVQVDAEELFRVYISVYISVYIRVYISVYISVYIRVYIRVYISVYISVYIRVYIIGWQGPEALVLEG
ncbi:hypothetical protein DV737_g4238, partial [Chaetothyriales sp. CBS 132003]